ncbi:Zn-ribbon domain-containing OB-fold protein [Streptosporangium sp. NPDC002607]
MSGPALPVPTPETRFYWDRASQGELWLRRCGPCDRAYFYPRDHCPFCGGAEVSWVRARGRGRLASYVISHRPAPGYDDVPFVIALVELVEGPRMLTNILEVEPDPSKLPIGLELDVVFERRGDISVPQFRPVGEAGHE